MFEKIRKSKTGKALSLFIAFLLIAELGFPLQGYALTSGPSQPEVQSFEPIATTDMVDLFSGDYNYNIPLMQVGNYPVNLFYHAGIGMDQEASWTGLGWNLNPGVINRSMRGIPDDFNGDKIVKEQNIRPNETIGLSAGFSLETCGIGFSPGTRFYYNNYKGIGFGLSSGLDIGCLSMNFGYDNQEGIDASLSVTAEAESGKGGQDKKSKIKGGATLGYNSRTGFKGLTITYSATQRFPKGKKISAKASKSTTISFAAPTYTPFSTPDMASFASSFKFSIGGEAATVYMGGYISADFQSHRLLKKKNTYSSMGYLYSRGHNSSDMIMDFNRDKQVELNKYTKFLHTTNHTYDIYSVSGQGTGGMYRPFRSNVGMVYDPETQGVDLSSLSVGGGVEVGVGATFKIGGDVQVGVSLSHSGPWKDNFKPYDSLQFDKPDLNKPLYETAYFKTVGERTVSDQDYYNDILDTKALTVQLNHDVFNTRAEKIFRTKEGTALPIDQKFKKTKRDKRNQVISYLTGAEASKVGLERKLKFYEFVGGTAVERVQERVNSKGREAHHISEIVVINPDGTRYVYGIAAYNYVQKEYSFSVAHQSSDPVDGLVTYEADDITTNNKKGRDHYFTKETTPPYAHSYLLTAVLSPDYVDVTDDGITEDDLGMYTKLNYVRVDSSFKWRTPHEENQANYNHGLRSDDKDDKASFVYGEKEVWHVYSIETKTQTAEFSLSDRNDGFGVQDENGGIDTDHPLYQLDSISLYSKPDRIENGNNAIAIKKVHFGYQNVLCKNLPNSTNDTIGKLTLKELYFTYGNNSSGALSPYVFGYDEDNEDANPDYDTKASDRWGNYKPNDPSLLNSDFPYTSQSSQTDANTYAGAWNLKDITLPSGGHIDINYESDDYGYVQDKAAMCMYKVRSVSNNITSVESSASNRLYSAPGESNYVIQFELNEPVSNASDLDELFTGFDRMYFNFQVNLSNGGNAENVGSYVEVDSYGLLNDTTAYVKIKPVDIGTGINSGSNVSPIAKAAWQFTRVQRPQIAYPGSENNGSPVDIAKSMLGFFSSIAQMIGGFNQELQLRSCSKTIDISHSWIRLNAQNRKKLGGGHRVQEIAFTDNWNNMGSDEQAMTYGQSYLYEREDGSTSGVAEYEPTIGGDENPWRVPAASYTVNNSLAPDDDHYIEGPIGESFFPSPGVGYERVVVRNITPEYVRRNATGYTVNEFYTAREFPVKIETTPIDVVIKRPNPILTFLNFYFEEYATAAQGYAIQLNDMHGKQKAQTVYPEDSNVPVSSVRYFYKVDDENALIKTVNNTAKVMNREGAVAEATIGKEIEMVVDTKEKSDYSCMTGMQINVDGFILGIIPIIIPIPFPDIAVNKRGVRFATTTKIINRFGILDRTQALQNGATITTYNEIFDEETGEVLLSRTQNEFDDNIYNFSYPAHFAYDGMGPAYKNIGAQGLITIEDTVATGLNEELYNLFVPGDEVLLRTGPISKKAWVLDKTTLPDTAISFIDKNGSPISDGTYKFKIIRSGRRNQQSTSIGSVVSKKNPIAASALNVNVYKEILNSSATVFSEEWQTFSDKGILSDTTMNCSLSGVFVDNFIEFLDDLLTLENDTHSFPGPYLFTNNCDSNTSCTYYYYGGLLFEEPEFDDGFGISLNRHCAAPENCCRLTFNTVDNSSFDLSTITSFSPEIVFDPSVEGWQSLYQTGLFVTANTPTGPVVLEISTGSECLDIEMECVAGDPLISDCGFSTDSIINPYLQGVRGIWRAKKGYAYNSSRNYSDYMGNANDLSTQYDGTYSDFSTFWNYSSNIDSLGWNILANVDTSKWVWTSEVTKYHPAGNEVENRDALGRYSSALFGYWNTQATAVASNAKYKQIAFDGFEDYDFQDIYLQNTCHFLDHWNFIYAIDSESNFNYFTSHTGKYSLDVAPGDTMWVSRNIRYEDTIPHPEFLTQYKIKPQDNLGVFSPDSGTYVLGMWIDPEAESLDSIEVRVRFYDTTSTELTGSIAEFTANSDQPFIEGWKRFEQKFEVPGNAASIKVELINANNDDVYFDDIRIHPFNSNMKTFVYDRVSMRLVAQLDENNYATFYEYDDQGTLIRVKKETERGIVTLQENRQSINKHPQ